MPSQKSVIVNADDFGLSRGVNRGVFEGHERGIVTSASLMVRWPAASEAAADARDHPDLSVGLHFDAGEWVYRDGGWVPLYEVVAVEDRRASRDEARRQLEAFHHLVGRDPTHVDSHQHVHRREPIRSVLIELAEQLDAPLRHYHPRIRYCGRFYGQTAEGLPLPGAIRVESLVGILEALPAGITELDCHPADRDDLGKTMYRAERVEELEVLCDPRVRRALADHAIELQSFAGVSGGARSDRAATAGPGPF